VYGIFDAVSIDPDPEKLTLRLCKYAIIHCRGVFSIMYSKGDEWMPVIRILVAIATISFVTTLHGSEIDDDIARIKRASPDERVSLMNDLKRKIYRMNREERRAAIERLRSSIASGRKRGGGMGVKDSSLHAKGTKRATAIDGVGRHGDFSSLHGRYGGSHGTRGRNGGVPHDGHGPSPHHGRGR
jgi:hypothetical protein